MYLWCDTHTAQHPHAKTRYSERGQAVPLQKCLMWHVYSSVCVCVCWPVYVLHSHCLFHLHFSLTKLIHSNWCPSDSTGRGIQQWVQCFSLMQIVQENNLSHFVSQTHGPKHTVVAEFCTLLLVQSQDKPSMQIVYIIILPLTVTGCGVTCLWNTSWWILQVQIKHWDSEEAFYHTNSGLLCKRPLCSFGVRLCARLQPHGQSVLPETSQSRTFTLRITEIL